MKTDLIIRAARAEDAESILALKSLPGYRHGTLGLPYPSIASIRDRVQRDHADKSSLVADREGAILGDCGLIRYDGRRAHVGYLGMGVHDHHVGTGIGTALMRAMIDLADNWLNLRRVELTVFVDNEPAIGLYSKFGFEQEGMLRDFAFRDGRYVDAFAMARMKA